MAPKRKSQPKVEYSRDGISDAQVRPRAPGAGVQIPLLTVRAVEDLGPVSLQPNSPHVLRTADGREYVCKGPERGYALVAEYVCARLCERLGLAVPSPAIVRFNEVNYFGSTNIPKQDPWLPGRTPTILNPEAAGPLMVFDIFCHNTDRHPDNIVFEQVVQVDGSSAYRLWGVDFGAAIFRDGLTMHSLDGAVVGIVAHELSSVWGLVDSREQLDRTIGALQARPAAEFEALLLETPAEWWLAGRTPDAVQGLVSFFVSRQAQLRHDVEGVFPALYQEREQ